MIRKHLLWILPVISISFTILWGIKLAALGRMFLAILPLILSLKLSILMQLPIREYSKLGLILYLLLWPGMNPKPFKIQSSDRRISRQRVFIGIAFFSVGIVSLFLIAVFRNIIPQSLSSWGAVFAFLITFHFGFSELLTQSFRYFGWRVSPLFLDPFLSMSLREFWSKRWNLAFVEMNKIIFLPLARKSFNEPFAIFAVFFISALLHEFAISFPVHSGWGGPLLYFILHGLLITLESHTNFLAKSSNLIRRVWTFGWLFIPLPMLFHAPFRDNLILPIVNFLHEVLC